MKVAKMLCTLFIAGGLGSFVFARTQQIDDSAASSNSDEQQAHASGEMANIDYRLLATNKTSTMDKEMNEAADAGYRFQGVMGGETSFGGSEVVVVMSRAAEAPAESRYQYRLLATSKTSTMQKELQEAADAGFWASQPGSSISSSTIPKRKGPHLTPWTCRLKPSPR